ncbi:CRISPR-associated helicase Cas3' [Streptomyces hygroscopicus]|uniref:CRISPR-associated helicase Cas3' n=1 Tax=Streptomyces hygroscopicus TaxID=1912 RepID=UPI000AD2B51B
MRGRVVVLGGPVVGVAVVGAVEDARLGGIDLRPWTEFDAASNTVYPLLFGMLDSAVMAFEVWERVVTVSQRDVLSEGMGLPAEQARSVVAFLAGLQDLGRLVPRFQRAHRAAWARLDDTLVEQAGGDTGWTPTARSSMHVALGVLTMSGYACAGNASPAVRAAQVVGGCRGFFLQADIEGAASARRVAVAAGGEAWDRLRHRYAAVVRHLTGAVHVPERLSVPAAVLAAGVGTVAGQLARQRSYWLPKAHMPAFGAAEHFTLASGEARDVLDAAWLEKLEWQDVPFAVAHPRARRPNRFQESLMTQLPSLVGKSGSGILVAADATGTGKSVGALQASRIFNAACGSRGVAWLSPSTATADASWELLEDYVLRHDPYRAPVALAHSHSWLNAAYSDRRLAAVELAPVPVAAGERVPPTGDAAGAGDDDPVTEPPKLLRGHDAALLAPFCAATVDQAQMAVLPVHSNAVRLLGLSGKTVVVDEAHALSAFSHLQLLRLLGWFGSLRTPVVLLSATLPASTADALVRAYLTGAGHRASALPQGAFSPSYPGWLFADAATATATVMDETARLRHAAGQHRQARIRVHDVRRTRLGPQPRTVGSTERLAVIGDVLTPVISHGGCAAVTCATVPDAQDTYRHLKHTWPGDPADLVLLHARFPGHHRERLLRTLRRRLGPTGQRPERIVVVTTSLLDTSLDIDVDLMVSDLASVARLLQRLGRLARFALRWQNDDASRRPVWWGDGHIPDFHVLEPVSAAGATSIPAGWRTLESPFVLRATADLLRTRSLISLPGDVQDLVEQIHGPHSPFAEATEALRYDAARLRTKDTIERHLSAQHLLPPPGRVSSLADLHRQRLTTAQAATRLGTLPVRLLPCYRTASGGLALDRAGRHPLPAGPRLETAGIRRVLQHTLPVPAAWVARRGPQHRPPEAWSTHPLLADLVLLPAPAHHAGHTEQYGRYLLRMDDELGLVHTTAR